MHDATKILLGSSKSNVREVDNKLGTVAAGLCVHLADDGSISYEASAGSKIGVSMGKDLSDIGRTAIARKGLKVPVLLTAEFVPDIGAQVHIADATGMAAASGGGATGVNAVYASGVLTGITEAGAEVEVALIDFPGGL
jgi:hypothetical protein